jgi:hypothetical protein
LPYASVSLGPLLFALPIADRDANTPVKLSVPAQAIDWTPTDAQALPDAPVAGKNAQPIRLVPYGCTKFRISMFPVTPRAWASN